MSFGKFLYIFLFNLFLGGSDGRLRIFFCCRIMRVRSTFLGWVSVFGM